MPTWFFTAQENIPPGLGFRLFGPSHLLWLAGTALFAAALCLLCRRAGPRLRRRLCLGLCLAMLALELGWLAILLATDQFTWNYLPLDLCDLAVFGELLCLLRPGPVREELGWCLWLPGAAMALLFPNWTPLPPLNFLYLRSFFLHALLVTFPLLRLAGGELRPDPRRLPACLAAGLALCVPVYGVDRLLDQNFFFLNAPSPGSPLELFARWFGEPGYLLGIPLLLAPVWLLLYLPPILVRRRRKG